MPFTCVIAEDGAQLMPTSNVKKVRALLRNKKALIVAYKPFTIQLCYKSEKATQPIEFACDAGYLHVGVSVKSESHEYVSAQYDLLTDETEKHNDCRKYRKARRNHKRYRKCRFNNRKIPNGWLAPSIKNKAEMHRNIFKLYKKHIPIMSVTFEMGQFDTQVLEAVQKGVAIPTSVDYQYGPTYGYDTLREAVFARDFYTCQVCKKSVRDGVILRMHHLGFKIGDRSNRMNNLLTVCTHCHTSKNHKPGGVLYELKPKLNGFKGAAFMNNVKWYIYNSLKSEFPLLDMHITYGAVTKRERLGRNLTKSHANDAYCIGIFRPSHRTETLLCAKKRRNNRVLEKFYDAKYVDVRTGELSSGCSLSCGRTNRSEPRNGVDNQRVYRGLKISAGRRTIRKKHYAIRPGDKLLYQSEWFTSKGMQNLGSRVILKENGKSIPIKQITNFIHVGGWQKI